VERAARAFLEALRRSDLEALVAASPGRFDFDGEAQSGADAIRRTWRAILASRDAPAPPIVAVEVLTAADAIARHGKPPQRIGGLVRPGVWVAIADLGGRPVVLFLAKDGARHTVLGLHD